MRKKISDEKLFKDHKSLFYSCPIKNDFPSIELNIKGNDNQANILGNGLVILNRIKKDSICFVGLNPSIPEDMDPSGLYDKINVKFDDDKVHYNSLNENDKGNKSNDLQYFKRLQNVAAKIGYNWSALDIFSLRCTNMSAIKDALDKDAGAADYKAAEEALYTESNINPLYFRTSPVLRNPNLKDVRFGSTGLTYDFKTAYLK